MSCISNSVRSLEGSPKLLSEAALCIIRGRIKLESHCLEAHKTQRSLGFMPRVWKSLFQNKNCCFAVLAPWQKPPVHDFCLIMEMDGSGDVFAWHAELRANQSRERSCSSTARLVGPPSARTQQQQHTGSWTGCTIRTGWVQLELFFPSPFIQRFSLAYTWNYTLFNICLHFKTSGKTNPYQRQSASRNAGEVMMLHVVTYIEG